MDTRRSPSAAVAPGSGRAPFACAPQSSRGRLHREPESTTRSLYQRDRDRVIHSTAFRRLTHKTQVFVYHEGDHYRTRLTHSLEVAQIARTIARALGLDEDLTEALALAHDLGHTPFGHAGEEALDAAMREWGGFDHNAQTLRILTCLERRYADFDGLNLTWETLEGVVKHNGPVTGPLPAQIAEYDARHDLELATFASAEAQVASLSDDIAYNNHDIDDGLRAGLFTVADLADVPIAGAVFRAVAAAHPALDEPRLIGESIRRLIDLMVGDVLAVSRARIAQTMPTSAADVRHLDAPLIQFSPAMAAEQKGLRAFLFRRMYRHARVTEATDRARQVVRDLFEHFIARPDSLPPEWRSQADRPRGPKLARLVADYIAGMTDRFAFEEHKNLV